MTTSTDTWIARVKAADAEAEAAWRGLQAPVIEPRVAQFYALRAIAAELRAQRIARRPGVGQ